MRLSYLNELAPWERKNEYHHTIQLGEDVRTQTKAINNSTKAMVATQIASTNAIIASQERINEGIDKVAYGIERIEEGIYGLQAAFEWGISEVVWQIEQNREVLKSILEVLMAPLDTQAKERRKRAENAYSNGWINDAEEEFLETEKLNRYDFAIHISLGMIYLFRKIDKEKALEYFEKAIKYARPESNYHTSYALLYKGLIMRDYGQIEEAEKCTAEAVELSPDFADALYQNAQYNAQLRNVQKSIANLAKAIKIDKNYCLKADKDNMFDPVRKEVNRLFERLRDEIKKFCINTYQTMELAIKETNSIISENSGKLSGISFNLNDFSNEIREISKLLNRNSYFDSLDAHPKSISLNEKSRKYINNAEKSFNNYFDNAANAIKLKIRNILKNDKEKNKEQREKITGTGPGCLLWFCLYVGGIIWVIKSEHFFDNHQALGWIVVYGTMLGGWFIAKGILKIISNLLYQEKDFSKFISKKQKEMDNIKTYQNNITVCFSNLKNKMHYYTEQHK